MNRGEIWLINLSPTGRNFCLPIPSLQAMESVAEKLSKKMNSARKIFNAE